MTRLSLVLEPEPSGGVCTYTDPSVRAWRFLPPQMAAELNGCRPRSATAALDRGGAAMNNGSPTPGSDTPVRPAPGPPAGEPPFTEERNDELPHTDASPATAMQMREDLIAHLRAEQKIVSAAVEAAIRQVPRERFMPQGTPLEDVYAFDRSVVTKRDEHGVAVSSVSAAYIQARMLEQANLLPGAVVLEIGSGGLNAAYAAEIVGPDGRVVSVDIDTEVVHRAATLLDAAGYGGRVRVLAADAEHRIPDEPNGFDAIIVTVGAWDVAPVWIEQLRPGATLVLPLIMNGVTRTIGFVRSGDHLVSKSVEVAGFVPMQGDGQHPDRVVALPDPNGRLLKLSFDSGAPEDLSGLDGALGTSPVDVWTGSLIGRGVSFADLHLWLAAAAPGFCRLSPEDGVDLGQPGRWFPFAVVRGAGLAYLTIRPAETGDGFEFGARGYGRDAVHAADALASDIRSWDDLGRQEPTFQYWPTGADHDAIPDDACVLQKRHGAVSISWPSAG